MFDRYRDAIKNIDLGGIKDSTDLPSSLLLGCEGNLSAYYIPFDFVNLHARVVLVGITPGFTQVLNALSEAQKQLRSGATGETVLRCAKKTGAFSGGLRKNLIALLDAIGLQRKLEIDSCADLFESRGELVQTTSVLRHPIFVSGQNYNGAPEMVKHPFLRKLLVQYFGEEARQLPDAIYIPLGPKVAKGLGFLAAEGILNPDRILGGLPHPSGANAERIAYFLGKKKRESLSAATDPGKLDQARQDLISRLSKLKHMADYRNSPPSAGPFACR